jgi:hypothetical protein
MSAGPPVDPRGPRLAAWITTVVLAVAVLAQWWALLAVQTVVFAIGAFAGLKYAPYSLLYRYLVAPRLKPADEREDAAPLRFAQGVGFVFAAAGTVAFAAGLTVPGIVATAFALVAAFLNAAFGLCLGCESYLLLRRFTTSRPSVNPTTQPKVRGAR